MNQLKYIIPLLLLYTLGSCKKEKLLTYETKDNVYFNWVQQVTVRVDTLNLSFAYSPVTVRDSTFLMPVIITGAAVNQDREYSVTVDPASTATADHYVLPKNFYIRAGKLTDSFPIKLLRVADLQDTTKTLILNLHPNANFNTDLQKWPVTGDTLNTLIFKINISDILQAGPYWTSVFATYFGTFSVKKLQLMNQVVGMPLNFPTIVGLSDLNLAADASFYAISMSRYLQDQTTAGDTVYDPDGVTPMTMGASYQ